MKKKAPLFLLSLMLLTSCSVEDFFTSNNTSNNTNNNTNNNSSSDDINHSSASEDKESESVITSDPYTDMTEAQFYKNYKPATSYLDAKYRTQHNFMSGSITVPKQKPTIASSQPKEGGKFVRNSKSGLSSDGLEYTIVDSKGNPVNTIYKGGAYITLEEVAAYLYAFGDVPKNYVTSRKTKPSNSKWEKYLRLNHSYFSGDTDKYPYEPLLPDLDTKKYYEIDIGTTGCEEYANPPVRPYNDGDLITRGTCRIVYTRYSKTSEPITDPNERYIFYTYDHYNDFQEYLNYENGWGKWFGNIAGGGELNNNTARYKTSYPEVVRRDF